MLEGLVEPPPALMPLFGACPPIYGLIGAFTYLLWLRYQHLRGRLDDTGLAAENTRVRESLAGESSPHWQAFMEAWDVPPEPTTD